MTWQQFQEKYLQKIWDLFIASCFLALSSVLLTASFAIPMLVFKLVSKQLC